MSAFDVVLVHSAFDSLRLGRSAQTIGCRRLHFWTRKTSRSKKSVIGGFIPAGRAPYCHPSLRAGSVFIPQTTTDEVIENSLVINLEKFMLRKFDPLQALANTNFELPGLLLFVVGQFQSVQSLDLKDTTVMSQVVIQSVMVVTTVNPKIFGGNLYLNSTPATKFYFDLVLQAITEFTASLEGPVGEVFPCIDTKEEEIKKKEVVSIGDLNKHMKLILFAKLGLLRCCNKMAGLLSLALDAAGSSTIQGLLSIATDVLIRTLPKEILKLTKQDAASLTLDEMNVGGSEELPQCLKELAGKYFVFQIRVKPLNFTPNHHTFTVFAIVNHINPRKVANHPHLSPAMLGVKPMNHIHPVLKAKRVAVNAPAIEVTKLFFLPFTAN
ncbi:hypothetical protein DY000_02029935 [Brassica cretica]|uniref:Uncharacterized protein n=1 Tax=Brassica cretica TaxID=69181 RepID=A0ABQ7DJR2_BRACR|nr:hypothetical protein DY000_02029935 [Brassica cretica]